MTEGKNDKWLGWLALSTAIMAVLAAVTTLYVGKYSSRAVLLQGQESNQWAYFQAKSIKQHAYEIQRERLELELLAGAGRMAEGAQEKYRARAEGYGGEVVRYEKEKREIREKAEGLEKRKESAQHMAGSFGYSLIFLQIAIMLSSIASLTRRRSLWYLGMAATSGWGVFFVDAFVPFL